MVLAVILAGAGAGTARAQAGIVLESYTGQRASEAPAYLTTVLDELAARGFQAGYAGLGRRYEAEVSRPGRTVAGLPTTFVEDVERGHKAWIRGRFEEAVQILAPLVSAAHANPAGWTSNGRIRDQVQRALIALSLAQHRMGDPASARAVMSELIRSFPQANISRAVHGPEAFTLYEEVRRELGGAARARLRVETSDAKTTLFLNETFVGVGKALNNDLMPGDYRVYAVLGDRQGRSYRVTAAPGADVTLVVDWTFDQTLHTSPDWTGFVFATDALRSKYEAEYAARVARATRASAVVVIGLDTIKGRPALVGSLVSTSGGRELRRASLALEPEPTDDKLKALARFLAGDRGATDDGLNVIIAPREATPEATPEAEAGAASPRRDAAAPRRPSRWGAWKYASLAGGVAGLGAGGYLISLHGSCSSPPVSPTSPCPTLHNTRLPGLGLGVVGAGLVGLGIYMFLTDRAPTGAATGAALAPLPGGALATWAGQF
jgi:hypothetical protein